MFWWWGLIEEENYYPMYKAVSNFMKGEDNRDPSMKGGFPTVLFENGTKAPFKASTYHGKTKGQGWIYYTGSKWTERLPKSATANGLTLTLKTVAGGTFDIEFWDTIKGTRIFETTAKSENSKLIINVPEFTRDIGFKVKRRPSGRRR